MDNTINLGSGATQLYTSPIISTATTDSLSGPVKQTIPSVIPAAASSEDAQLAQHEAAFNASISFKNTYAVSDHSFSIFKDANGTLITRYVSLRDGTITYLPEPTLVRHTQPVTASPASTGKLLISV